MSYSHFFFIEENHLKGITELMRRKNDDEYIVIANSKGYSDIIQYSAKFQNLKVITCKSENLNRNNELVI